MRTRLCDGPSRTNLTSSQGWGRLDKGGGNVLTRLRCVVVTIGMLACLAAGCTMDEWLWPFGSYYYFSRGLDGSGGSLTTGTNGLTGTTGGITGTGGTTTGTNGTTGTTTGTGTSGSSINDDFSDGALDGWTVVSGNWSVNTAGYLEGAGPSLDGYHIITVGDDNWTDYEVEFDVRLQAGAEYAVGVRFTNEETWYHCSSTTGGVVGIWNFTSGLADQQLDTGVAAPLSQGQWYHMRVTVQGTQIYFYIEGARVAFANDTARTIPTGRVALLVAPGAVANFDNVVVSPLGQ